MNIKKLKLLLYPFSVLHGLVIRTRHWLYDKGLKKSKSFDVPVIKVGNLNLGGTGKTPHAEYILGMFEDKFKSALLSRGYKRKSVGFQLASKDSTPDQLGDEAFQIFRKFPNAIVAVDNKRVNGMEELCRKNIDVVVLDDALQHRSLDGGLSILLMDFNRPFYKDFLWPSGTLRDVRNRITRMDVIIITKCPTDLTKAEQLKMVQKLQPKLSQQVFFTCYMYNGLLPVFKQESLNGQYVKADNVLLFSGIANNEALIEKVSDFSDNVRTITFGDHHNYGSPDIYKLIKIFDSFANGNNLIVTTEKDAVKLMAMVLPHEFKLLPIYYLPIKVHFLDRNDYFEELIYGYVRKNKGNS
ncbi:MAG: tetraacyldisaccharide 4'-kinase [Urechidicola sp.]